MTRVATVAAAATIGVLTSALVGASPALAMNPCQSDNPPAYCDNPPPPAPPATPTNLAAISVLQSTVTLQWKDVATNEGSYHVRRVVNNVGSTVDLAANTAGYTDSGVPTGSRIDYYVWATRCVFDQCSDSGSAHLSVQTHPAPSDAAGGLNYGSGLTAWGYYNWSGWAADWDTTSPIQVETLLDGVVQQVYTAGNNQANFNQTNPGYGDNHGFNVYVFKNTTDKGTHQACLRALNFGAGRDTDIVCASYVTPGKPSPATALSLRNTGTSMVVSFTDNAADETGYYLQRSTDAGASWLAVGNEYAPVSGSGGTGTATDYSSPPAGTCYRILMTNSYGDSPSAQVCS
jgi:hypothetical protein